MQLDGCWSVEDESQVDASCSPPLIHEFFGRRFSSGSTRDMAPRTKWPSGPRCVESVASAGKRAWRLAPAAFSAPSASTASTAFSAGGFAACTSVGETDGWFAGDAEGSLSSHSARVEAT